MKRMEARTLARCLAPGDRVRVNVAEGPDEAPMIRWLRAIAVRPIEDGAVIAVDYGDYGILCTMAETVVRIRPCNRGIRG